MIIIVTYHKPVQGRPKRQSEVSSARRSQGHTLNYEDNTQYSIFFQVKSCVISLLRNTQYALFYFLKFWYT